MFGDRIRISVGAAQTFPNVACVWSSTSRLQRNYKGKKFDRSKFWLSEQNQTIASWLCFLEVRVKRLSEHSVKRQNLFLYLLMSGKVKLWTQGVFKSPDVKISSVWKDCQLNLLTCLKITEGVKSNVKALPLTSKKQLLFTWQKWPKHTVCKFNPGPKLCVCFRSEL